MKKILLFPAKDKRLFYEKLKEANILTKEQWNTIHLDEIATISTSMESFTGYISYDINNYIVIDERSSKIMFNQHIYQFSDIIGYEEGDNAITKDVQGPEQKVTQSSRRGLGRAVVGGMIAGPAGAIVGGFTGHKTTVTSSSGKVSYSVTVHEYMIRIRLNKTFNPFEVLYFHNNENEMKEVSVLLGQILSMR